MRYIHWGQEEEQTRNIPWTAKKEDWEKKQEP